MCTVTFIPSGEHFFFTSSRDEHAGRPNALSPASYEINGQPVLFPKDPKGGGSWIAISESGHSAVLLNGAFKAHDPGVKYTKSRGLILLDIISMHSPSESFREMNLDGIEPFTIILFENKKLWSCVWDGRKKHIESLNIHQPHIWSSVTLYSEAAIQKRESWFQRWLLKNPYPSVNDIVLFHQQGGDGDPYNDLLMKRDTGLFTNSISAIRYTPESASFLYIDLRSGEKSETSLVFQKTIELKA